MAVFKRKNKDGEEGKTWYVDYRDRYGNNWQGTNEVENSTLATA
jgi:hypothetical protein